MSLYCTADDVRKIVAEDRVKKMLDIDSSGEIEDSRFEEFIEMAGDEIEAAVGGSYKLPITGEQSLAVLKGIARNLTKALMYSYAAEGELPEALTNQIQRFRDILDKYADKEEGYTLWDAELLTEYIVDSPCAVDPLVALGTVPGDYDDD